MNVTTRSVGHSLPTPSDTLPRSPWVEPNPPAPQDSVLSTQYSVLTHSPLLTHPPVVSTRFPARRAQARGLQRGFTLIELIVVVTIIGILAAIAVVHVRNANKKALDTALAANLHEMRKAIDNFYADKQRYPSDLNELVPNYLRKIPPDPITRQTDWDEIQDQPAAADESAPVNPEDANKGPGIVDVKSKAPGKTLNGTPYSDL